jgi:hypothetical protein
MVPPNFNERFRIPIFLFSKVLKNPVWHDVLLDFCQLENAQNIMDNLSKGWQHIKGCHSKDDQHDRNVVIPMVVANSIQNIWQTNLLIGIHRKNFKKGDREEVVS